MYKGLRTARLLVCAFLGTFCTQIACAQTPPLHPPVEAFGQLPDPSAPLLSPDGRYFAMVRSLNGKPAAFVRKVDVQAATPENSFTIQNDKWTVDDVWWVKNNLLIVSFKQGVASVWDHQTRTFGNAIAVDPDTRKTFRLEIGEILDRNLSDPEYVLTDDYGASGRLNLYKASIREGSKDELYSGTAETISWITDGHGKVVGRVDLTLQPRRQHLFLLQPDNSWKEAISLDVTIEHVLAIHGLTADGKAIVLSERDNRGKYVLQRYDMATGARTELYSVPDYDVEGTLLDPWDDRVVGAVYDDDVPHYTFFDEERSSLQHGLEKAFPGKQTKVVSANLAHDRVIVAVEGPRSPQAYYYLNRTTHEASLIGSSYSNLTEADLGEMKPYPYAARDGLRIPAYLTLPPGKEPKNLPAVIMPHGGPIARDLMAFDWWVQFLANRGYAVLQPNFRGSSGYGKQFEQDGYVQWGLKMQDDVTDGVKKLIADGIADPNRICIVGASYGGYAALAGATFTPGLYKCAASWAGISDIVESVGTDAHGREWDSRAVQVLTAHVGSVFKDEVQLKATSPRLHAEKVLCPVLLMHGELDSTVEIGQSEIEEHALHVAGKHVTFIRIPGEDHYFTSATTRIRWLTEVEKFLKENIGN